MTTVKNVYLIFPYVHNGKKYRNQARRYAYRLWINATGKGYNKYPISPSMDVPFEEHWD